MSHFEAEYEGGTLPDMAACEWFEKEMGMANSPRKLSLLAQALEDAVKVEQAAREAVQEAVRALDNARATFAKAVQEVREARIAADSEMNSCLIHVQERFGRQEETTRPGVIVKQTSREIQVRGVGDINVMRFRQSKYKPERWCEYPSPNSFSSTITWVTFEIDCHE